MTSTAHQFESMKRAMKAQDCRKSEGQKIRTVNITKWKSFMLKTLESMLASQQYDGNLVEELRNFVKNISEEKYIEAIINMQPYKPKFTLCSEILKVGKEDRTSSKMHNFEISPRRQLSDQMTTTSGSLLNRTEIGQIVMAARNKRKEQLMSMFIEDQLLSKEISQPNHPYSRILQAFIFLLENKYKAMIEKNRCKEKVLSLDDLTSQLSMDFKFLENFFKITSVPILDILNLTDPAQRIKFREDLQHFMLNYLRNNQKICLSLRKIIRFYLKSSQQLSQFELNCPHSADIQLFGLPKPFQIQGCYIYATSQLISFIDLKQGKECLAKLSSIRQAIYKDLDQYYKSSKGQKEALEVSSEIQLQILKFSLVKLRIFAGEILAQLKLLQILYGSDEMAYHFDEASYIHSQMSIAFQAIQNNL